MTVCNEERIEALIKQRVETLFLSAENNCAMTVLRVLAEVFETPVDAQVIDAAQCMPGAGGMQHLCGLMAGYLMFVGVWGGQQRLHRAALRPITQSFGEAVLARFGSLDCADLRREGGCGPLAVDFLTLAVHHLDTHLGEVAPGAGNVVYR